MGPADAELGEIQDLHIQLLDGLSILHLQWIRSFMTTFSKAKLFCMCLSGWMKTDASFSASSPG